VGQAILSGVMTAFLYAMVVAFVWKVFQISTDLGEIKTLLKEMRQTPATPVPAPAGPISLESAEALLREVAAESRPKTTA
jgi:hypothetical protein